MYSNFDSYIERRIILPNVVVTEKTATGVVIEADGSLRPVLTKIVTLNGKRCAEISSITNSVYAVVYNNSADFKDISGHWANNAITDMAVRGIIIGMGSKVFEPDRSITRAEFAAILVCAMGLVKGTIKSSFSDVSDSDWFGGYIGTASDYKLVTGYSSKKYDPNDAVTREQAMVILARAMKLARLNTSLTSTEVDAVLAKYTASTAVSDYAKSSVAACISFSVASGSSEAIISPKAYVTSAVVAVMLQRFLKNAGLI